MSTVSDYIQLKAPAPRMISLAQMESILQPQHYSTIVDYVLRGFTAYSQGKVLNHPAAARDTGGCRWQCRGFRHWASHHSHPGQQRSTILLTLGAATRPPDC